MLDTHDRRRAAAFACIVATAIAGATVGAACGAFTSDTSDAPDGAAAKADGDTDGGGGDSGGVVIGTGDAGPVGPTCPSWTPTAVCDNFDESGGSPSSNWTLLGSGRIGLSKGALETQDVTAGTDGSFVALIGYPMAASKSTYKVTFDYQPEMLLRNDGTGCTLFQMGSKDGSQVIASLSVQANSAGGPPGSITTKVGTTPHSDAVGAAADLPEAGAWSRGIVSVSFGTTTSLSATLNGVQTQVQAVNMSPPSAADAVVFIGVVGSASNDCYVRFDNVRITAD